MGIGRVEPGRTAGAAARGVAVLLLALALAPGVAAPCRAAEPVERRLHVIDAVRADHATRVDAGVALSAQRAVAPYLGVRGVSLPVPDRSAGIDTVDAERMDLDALAGLRFSAGPGAAVHLVIKVGGATLDERNRLGTRMGGTITDLALSYSRSF